MPTKNAIMFSFLLTRKMYCLKEKKEGLNRIGFEIVFNLIII